MTNPITITLPGEPRGKGRPRFGNGRAYTDDATRAYEHALALAAKVAMVGQAPLQGPVAVTVGAYIGIPMSWSQKRQQEAIRGERRPTGKPDADNIIKTLDSFNAIVWNDDAQIVEATVIKKYSVQPALVVTVRVV